MQKEVEEEGKKSEASCTINADRQTDPVENDDDEEPTASQNYVSTADRRQTDRRILGHLVVLPTVRGRTAYPGTITCFDYFQTICIECMMMTSNLTFL